MNTTTKNTKKNIAVKKSTANLADSTPKTCIETSSTEEKLLARLKEAENDLADLYNNAAIGYHTISIDGTILSMNRTELEWLGYTEDELINKKTIFDIQDKASATIGRNVFGGLKDSGKITDVELQFKRKDGTSFPVQISSTATRNLKGEITSFKTIVKDITNLKKLEHEVRHSQKMEAISVLVAGIAHNFNNILTPIMTNAGDMLDQARPNSEEREMLHDIVVSAQKGAYLIKQMITLSKSSERYTTAQFDVREILSTAADFCKKCKPDNVTLEIRIPKQPIFITGSKGLITEAISHICSNAIEAMPKGGHLRLAATTAITTNRQEAMLGNPDSDTYAILSISDTGVGIPKIIQNRIFEPFFTTKGLASKNGLGLSVTYSILKDHNGFIDFLTDEDSGTTFNLYLPCKPAEYQTAQNTAKTDPSHAKSPDKKAGEGQGATVKYILAIDDDSTFLRMLRRLLEKSGYHVICTNSGNVALEILRDSVSPTATTSAHLPANARISLVLLDVVMPEINSEHLLQKLRRLTDTIPVIIVSGFGDTQRVNELVKHGIREIICKPFERITLIDAIKRALNEH